MARAEQMGFDTKNPVYHGTRADIQEFDLNKGTRNSDPGFYGKGHYFGSANQADNYAKKWNEEYLKQGENIIPVYIRGNFLEIINQGPMDDAFSREIVKLGYKGRNPNYPDTNGEIAKFLQSKGYDGVKVYAGHKNGELEEVSVFDPKNIRSVNAKFDPKKKDSSDILAGVTPLLGGASVAAALSGLTKGNRK